MFSSVGLEALDKDGWRGDELGGSRWRRYRGRKSGCAFRVGNGRTCIFIVADPEAALVLGAEHRDATILATASGEIGYTDIAKRLRQITVPVRMVVPPGGDPQLAGEAAAVSGAEVIQRLDQTHYSG
ncbi:MAG: hypothetical protein OXP36_05360 [Gammaproteobacteria bacterium]|nr:hypothetical protein [Gammaproteobacteria bacterium]